MDHEETYEHNWQEIKHNWDPYSEKDVIGLVSIYVGYSKHMQETNAFGMQDCLSLQCLGWNSIKDERDVGKRNQRIYTYTDKYIRSFFCQSSRVEKLEHLTKFLNHLRLKEF